MRKMLTMLSALAVLALAVPVHAADGVFNLSWDSCTGPVDRTITQDGLNSMYASVIGHDVPHKAYDVTVLYGNGTSRTAPDAWRFDAPGCQGSSFVTLDHLAPAAVIKTCPSFQPPISNLPVKAVSLVATSLPYDGTLMRITVANAYPQAAGENVNPALRYFLARFLFDHTFSVNGMTTPGADCGGLETSICFTTVNATYLTIAGSVETKFAEGGNRTCTAQGPSGCTPSAAKSSTWGAIKSQYRN